MINYDSILSAFDGKPTLLQWLKLVKKALDESVLKDITLKQDGANVVFTFNFEDGTSLSTPAVTLPKGDTGAKGDKGEQGVSVTGVDEVSNEVVGTQTLTTLRFNFSNGTNNEVVVHAENGKNASGSSLYNHVVEFENSNHSPYRLTYYSGSKERDTKESLLTTKPIGGILNGYTSSDGFVDYLGMVIGVENSTGDFIIIECDGLNKVTHTQNKFTLKIVNTIVTPCNVATGPQGPAL